jgi:hypothetical protein
MAGFTCRPHIPVGECTTIGFYSTQSKSACKPPEPYKDFSGFSCPAFRWKVEPKLLFFLSYAFGGGLKNIFLGIPRQLSKDKVKLKIGNKVVGACQPMDFC